MNISYEMYQQRYETEIQESKTSLLIYFEKSVGIGDHATHLEEMNSLVEKMTSANDKLNMLMHMFSDNYSKL